MNDRLDNKEQSWDGDERNKNHRAVYFQSPVTSGEYEGRRSSRNVSVGGRCRCCWWIEGLCIGDESRTEECTSCGKNTLHVACIERLLQDDDRLDNHIVCHECLIKRINTGGGGILYKAKKMDTVQYIGNIQNGDRASIPPCTSEEPQTSTDHNCCPKETANSTKKECETNQKRVREQKTESNNDGDNSKSPTTTEEDRATVV